MGKILGHHDFILKLLFVDEFSYFDRENWQKKLRSFA